MLLAQGHSGKPATLAFSVQGSLRHSKDPPLGYRHPSRTGTLGCTHTHSSGPLLNLTACRIRWLSGGARGLPQLPRLQEHRLHSFCLILTLRFNLLLSAFVCRKSHVGKVQPTNKNIIITQFSSAWASPGYSVVLHNSIVSP